MDCYYRIPRQVRSYQIIFFNFISHHCFQPSTAQEVCFVNFSCRDSTMRKIPVQSLVRIQYPPCSSFSRYMPSQLLIQTFISWKALKHKNCIRNLVGFLGLVCNHVMKQKDFPGRRVFDPVLHEYCMLHCE